MADGCGTPINIPAATSTLFRKMTRLLVPMPIAGSEIEDDASIPAFLRRAPRTGPQANGGEHG